MLYKPRLSVQLAVRPIASSDIVLRMRVSRTAIPDVLVIEPQVFCDPRGSFYESFNQRVFKHAVGFDVDFVQDNHSRSKKGVLRGLHYQSKYPQGKLVRVVSGSVFDVVVDLRQTSANRGHWIGMELSEFNNKQLWVPPGFAHGFLVLSESADLLYKTTQYYEPIYQRCITWNDPLIGIKWPITSTPQLSRIDKAGQAFADVEYFE